MVNTWLRVYHYNVSVGTLVITFRPPPTELPDPSLAPSSSMTILPFCHGFMTEFPYFSFEISSAFVRANLQEVRGNLQEVREMLPGVYGSYTGRIRVVFVMTLSYTLCSVNGIITAG